MMKTLCNQTCLILIDSTIKILFNSKHPFTPNSFSIGWESNKWPCIIFLKSSSIPLRKSGLVLHSLVQYVSAKGLAETGKNYTRHRPSLHRMIVNRKNISGIRSRRWHRGNCEEADGWDMSTEEGKTDWGDNIVGELCEGCEDGEVDVGRDWDVLACIGRRVVEGKGW